MEIKENLLVLWHYIESVFSFDPNSPLLFTQFQFWAFFAIVFAVFALFRNKRLLRNTYLFFVSVLFYYKTSGLFFGLLLFVTCSDFIIAQLIYRVQRRWQKRAFLILSVAIDLSILCYFKYAYFFADLVNTVCGTSFQVTNLLAAEGNRLLGQPFFSVDRIILPVGISFYTFQIISYTADVYRGLVKPVRNLFDFGFYVAFFPQLVAGPIVKASDFIPQLYRKYCLSRLQFGMAVFWILNGLLKKIILSDYLAVNFIDRVFDNPMLFSGFENLMALFAYSLQVYADFSGYTDIAIGLSLLMGFYLPRNFNSPYKAPNCSNFWKRWHISLSRWLQNYLYIPLGGNRNATFGTYFWILTITFVALVLSGNLYVAAAVLVLAAIVVTVGLRCPDRRKKIWANLNSMITMLLGGLWHGASCNFMIWGGLNGVGMIVYKFWRDFRPVVRTLWSLLILSVTGALYCLCPCAYMEPAARLHAVHHSQCDYQMVVFTERLAMALCMVGARMGRGCHLRIHHLHAPVLPFGFQSRPGHCQRDGMAHRHGNGKPNGDGMERQCGRHHPGLRQGVCPLRLRHGHTLVARQLETPLSHLVCTHAVAVDGCCRRVGRFHRLPIRHSRNATVHLFPILRRATSASPIRPMPYTVVAVPLCDTVKMTI